jgi:hypothetical protein
MEERIKAFALIAGVEYVSSLLLPFVPRDDWYFVACAAFNLFTIYGLEKFFAVTQLALDLFVLTILQIAIQVGGWLLYAIGFRPTIYNCSIHIIVIVTLLRILWVGRNDRTNTANPPGRRISGLDTIPSHQKISGIQK